MFWKEENGTVQELSRPLTGKYWHNKLGMTLEATKLQEGQKEIFARYVAKCVFGWWGLNTANCTDELWNSSGTVGQDMASWSLTTSPWSSLGRQEARQRLWHQDESYWLDLLSDKRALLFWFPGGCWLQTTAVCGLSVEVTRLELGIIEELRESCDDDWLTNEDKGEPCPVNYGGVRALGKNFSGGKYKWIAPAFLHINQQARGNGSSGGKATGLRPWTVWTWSNKLVIQLVYEKGSVNALLWTLSLLSHKCPDWIK